MERGWRELCLSHLCKLVKIYDTENQHRSMSQIPIEGFIGMYQIFKEKLTQKKKLEYWVKSSKNCLSEINLTLIRNPNSLHMQTYTNSTGLSVSICYNRPQWKVKITWRKKHFCVNMTFHYQKYRKTGTLSWKLPVDKQTTPMERNLFTIIKTTNVHSSLCSKVTFRNL